MQLLLRRRIVWTNFGVRFALWAKFDVTGEEQVLIDNYRVRDGYITIEASRRDMWRGAILGFPAAFFISWLIIQVIQSMSYVQVGNMQHRTGAGNAFANMPFGLYLLIFVGVWGLCGWLIFEQLRLAIKISDMLNGREFKDKSLVLMARRERAMIGYGYVFVQLLEKMKNWEGTEVIQIGEEHEGALRLVTDVYAPS